MASTHNQVKRIQQGFIVPALVILAALVLISGIYLYNKNKAASHTTVAVSQGDNDTDEITANQHGYIAAVAAALSQPKVKYTVSSSTPQFVIFSFDGSKSVPMLDETLAFQQKMQAENKPIHFTYFINAAYFLTADNASVYLPPATLPRGTSKIGFSNTTEDISLRVREFNKAFEAGNEIGSHSAGHFDGTAWSYADWKQEFNSFSTIMSNVQQNNPSVPIDTPTFLTDIHGFRAPNLGINQNLYKVLADSQFTYDASGVNGTNAWPYKDANGLWHVPLGMIYLGPNKSPVISMDYNVWVKQSGAQELAVQGTQLWNDYYTQVESAYTDYFNSAYNGNRQPIVIADHFSKWNDGVYWEALKTFAENVCGQPNVQCVTFKDVVNYMNTVGAPPLARN